MGSLKQSLDRVITVSAGHGHDEGVGQHRGQKPFNGRLRGGTSIEKQWPLVLTDDRDDKSQTARRCGLHRYVSCTSVAHQ